MVYDFLVNAILFDHQMKAAMEAERFDELRSLVKIYRARASSGFRLNPTKWFMLSLKHDTVARVRLLYNNVYASIPSWAME
jgi:hypothetical protein